MFEKFGEFLANRRQNKLHNSVGMSDYAFQLDAMRRNCNSILLQQSQQEIDYEEMEAVAAEHEALIKGVLDGEVIMVDFRNRYIIPISEVVEVDETTELASAIFYDQEALGWD